ncbi:hypothetical protein Taro_043152, partial [Colocasia esculenta]|nr:hypothetical protein [Colocasia esculenta]
TPPLLPFFFFLCSPSGHNSFSRSSPLLLEKSQLLSPLEYEDHGHVSRKIPVFELQSKCVDTQADCVDTTGYWLQNRLLGGTVSVDTQADCVDTTGYCFLHCEDMNDLVHPKRANAVDTEDPIGKKPKVTPSLEENSGEEGSHDVHVSEENKPAPVEENSLKIFNSGGSVTQDSRENSPKDMSHDLGALDQRNSELSIIEAYAAEDKGSRHSMEDAWVVLPDASMEFPGPLRCAHFAIYDGHGGRLAAEYAQKHLHENVLSAGLPRELVCLLVLPTL